MNWRDERIPVRLIYPDKLRHSAQALERLPITLPNGTTVFLRDVADLVRERGFNTINRRDMRRLAMQQIGDLTGGVMKLVLLIADLANALARDRLDPPEML